MEAKRGVACRMRLVGVTTRDSDGRGDWPGRRLVDAVGGNRGPTRSEKFGFELVVS